MGCRLPGANSPAEFWRNLCAGVESVRFFSDQELAAAGVDRALLENPRYVRAAPILEGVDQFDAGFFGYSPKEAALLDPQQRLFLEVAWESFEDAGYDPQLHEDLVGVFAGAGGVVTSYLAAYAGHPALTGQTGSLEHISNDKDFLSTRVSYELNLTGPSLTVQTACSTSLVAVHLACQSLLSGECDAALAGASTVRVPHVRGYLAEENSIYSSDGHCRSFDAAGTGTIFGSGVAAVLLKPLAAAIAAGDNIYAVIRGTAVNNDGSRKASYTAPSVQGEARAMVEALEVAGLSPDSIGYVECHATGTVVGDPLEIRALTQAFRTRTNRNGFCAVGSAKTNIGHAEQTAGLAGLIKTALILRHGVIPPTLHLVNPNPEIGFEKTPFYVPTKLTLWKSASDAPPRRGGVNSLGIGGTNAFAVLEQAPTTPRAEVDPRPSHLLCVSAKSESALRARIAQVQLALESPSADAGDICFTVNSSRSGLPYRSRIQGRDREELARKSKSAAQNRDDTRISAVNRDLGPVAFLLSGQGSQYPTMGADLYRTQPTFRAAIEECDALFRQQQGSGLVDLIVGDGEVARARLGQTMFTQPAVFAIDFALAQVWRSWGLEPAAVIGHSLGELAAACVAGVFTLADGFRFVTERAALMQSIKAPGAMLAALADEETTRRLLSASSTEIAVACLNGPRNTVLSGPAGAIDELARRCGERNVPAQRLAVSHAFHSGMMDPILDRLGALESKLAFGAPRIPLASNVTGDLLTDIPPGYWREHVRRPVRFADGMATLRKLGVTTFLEVGPGSALLAMGRQCLPDLEGLWLASLDRRHDGWTSLFQALGGLYLGGFNPRWSRVEAGFDRRRVPLPTYPFERKRHWLKPAPLQHAAAGLVGEAIPSGVGPAEVAMDVGVDSRHVLADHRICGWTVMPIAAIALDAIAAGRTWLATDRIALENFRYHRALLFPERGGASVKLAASGLGPHGITVQVLASGAGGTVAAGSGAEESGTEEGWREHASGRLSRPSEANADRQTIDTGSVGPPRQRGWEKISAERLYADLRGLGLEYGPAFRNITTAWRGDGVVRSRVIAPANVARSRRSIAFLDACLHVFPLLLKSRQPDAAVFLPVGVDRFVIERPDAPAAWVETKLRNLASDGRSATIDVRVVDDEGRLVARLEGMALRLIPRRDLHAEGAPLLRRHLYAYDWEPKSRRAAAQSPPGPSAWVMFADRGGVAAAIAHALRRSGHHCHLVFERSPTAVRDDVWTVDPERPQAYRALLEKIAAMEKLPLAGMLFASALDIGQGRDLSWERIEAAEKIGLRGALYASQALTATPAFRNARFWVITRNAQSTASAVAPAVGQAPVLGFCRTFALEHPRQWGAAIDLPSDPGADLATNAESVARDATLIADELVNPGEESQVAFRGQSRYAARLVRQLEQREDARPVRYRGDATYLITGGLGMIGLRTAQWMVATQGVRHLVLSSRRPPRGKASIQLAALRRAGARVRVVKADVAERRDVQRLLATIDRQGPPLMGIVHCAGVLADGVLAQQRWERFTTGTAAKIRGAWLLHELTLEHGLEVFVLHSSLLSLTGSVAQANYTAANAFLDALCDYRRNIGLPAMAINWGPWAEAGMAKDGAAGGDKLWRRLGTEMIPPAMAIQVLEHLHNTGAAHAALTICDWKTYVERTPGSGALFGRLLDSEGGVALSSPAARGPLAPGRDLLSALQAMVMEELGFDEPIDIGQPLNELGLDSLMAVNLVNRLDSKLGVRLPLVKLIEGPSLRELAAGIAPQLGPRHDARATAPAPTAETSESLSRRWLVLPRPNPNARIRLFCFPFAGGGAATYRPWAESLHPSIELVGIEPPGRATRISEPPVQSMTAFLNGVLPEILSLGDKPVALFGHCLGALFLIEAARRLTNKPGVQLVHLFLSGSRPPAVLRRTGPFEENLLRQLLANSEYDPLVGLSKQPESAFGLALRQFDIGATEEFLRKPELRRLLMPAIRADFQIAEQYRPPAKLSWDVPITYFAARGDPYVTRADAMGWGEHTTRAFKIHFRAGSHFIVTEDKDFIVGAINDELGAARLSSSASPVNSVVND